MGWPETVRKSDFEIEWFSGTGAGGQYRNRHPNCCRLTHRPTGKRSTGQSNRERPANLREAFRSLAKILVPLMIAAQEREKPESQSAERVRTYHYPRRTVTDHRVPKESFPLEKTINGDLDPVIKAVQQARAKGEE